MTSSLYILDDESANRQRCLIFVNLKSIFIEKLSEVGKYTAAKSVSCLLKLVSIVHSTSAY